MMNLMIFVVFATFCGKFSRLSVYVLHVVYAGVSGEVQPRGSG